MPRSGTSAVFQHRQSWKWKTDCFSCKHGQHLTNTSDPLKLRKTHPFFPLARIIVSLSDIPGWMDVQAGKTKTVSSPAFLPAFVSSNKCFWYSDTQAGQHLRLRRLVWIFLINIITIQPSLYLKSCNDYYSTSFICLSIQTFQTPLNNRNYLFSLSESPLQRSLS